MFNIADMHCDTISALYNFGKSEDSLKNNNFHIDLERLNQADYVLQFFALYQDISQGQDPYVYANNLLELYNKELSNNRTLIKPILFKEDIDNLKNDNKIGALLTLEEGEACQGELDKLNEFFDKGVRLITLTWNNPNSLGFPNIIDLKNNKFYPETKNGLTSTGIEFIKRMEELGILVDVSHLSDKGFYDVYDNTNKPFVASHSNSRFLSPVPRNLTDDMIKKIGDRGGVIGLNFCGSFVNPQTEYATLEGLVNHTKYLIDKGGIDSVGLGTDFDGIPNSMDIKDCSQMPLLFNEYKKAGLSDDEIEKIASGNVLRVLKENLPSNLSYPIFPNSN